LAVQPIAEVLAKLSGIDPAAWVEGAPQAQLDLRGELRRWARRRLAWADG
jgi:hypothetical protein